MQANSDALSYSQEAARCCHLNMTYFKRSKRADKGQHRTRLRFWCGKYLYKITKRYRQFLQSYRVHKAAWPWASLKVQKVHTKVNAELVQDFYVENIHVKLQHDTGNLWRVITYTRFRTPPTRTPTQRQCLSSSNFQLMHKTLKHAPYNRNTHGYTHIIIRE